MQTLFYFEVYVSCFQPSISCKERIEGALFKEGTVGVIAVALDERVSFLIVSGGSVEAISIGFRFNNQVFAS